MFVIPVTNNTNLSKPNPKPEVHGASESARIKIPPQFFFVDA
jgi:hypothetical protein